MRKVFTSLVVLLAVLLSTNIYSQNFYLDANGVTVKCPAAAVNETGVVNIDGADITFTKRNAAGITDANASTTCTSGITTMSNLFDGHTTFNGDISSWDVSSVVGMVRMFAGAKAFNQDISSWDVHNVTNMQSTFNGASSFNQDISKWEVRNVTNMLGIFQNASSFNQDISKWDVRNVTTLQGAFNGASSFSADISKWDVSKVTLMVNMFVSATAFNHSLQSWDLSSLTNANGMLDNSGLSCENYSHTLEGWAANSNIHHNITLGALNLSYSSTDDFIINARNTLEGKGWEFVGDIAGLCATFSLPIGLLYFEAYKSGNTALLKWATATESSNTGFEIERSVNGADWQNIGFVVTKAVNGNSNIQLNYDFKDNHPLSGVNYYRLKQTDVSGQYSYSLIEVVTFENDIDIQLSPNPTKGIVTITGLSGNEKISVYNYAGTLLNTYVNNSGNAYKVSLVDKVPSVYLIRVDNSITVQSFKIIKN